MREIRTSGSEGGVELILHSYPYPINHFFTEGLIAPRHLFPD